MLLALHKQNLKNCWTSTHSIMTKTFQYQWYITTWINLRWRHHCHWYNDTKLSLIRFTLKCRLLSTLDLQLLAIMIFSYNFCVYVQGPITAGQHRPIYCNKILYCCQGTYFVFVTILNYVKPVNANIIMLMQFCIFIN